jgi:dTDP-4-dehydrorhamnose reductase
MKDFLILGGDSNLSKTFQSLFPNSFISLNKKSCDITSPDSIKDCFEKYNSKYVLNFAALTDMNYCEENKEVCFLVNVYSARNLLDLASKYNKKLIHISSNYALFPENNYGKSKEISENVLKDKSLIIRTSFYSKKYYIVKNLLNGEKTNAYTNIYFNPISITRVCKEIYKNKDKKTIINCFTKNKITNYDFGLKFCEIFNIDEKLIIPTLNSLGDKPKRPLDSFVKSDLDVSLEEDISEFKKYSLL